MFTETSILFFLVQIRVYGAPGPVYLNLLAATGKFMIIVVFLMFVMLVVMAFGNLTAMSSTNTTLATLAGGFVPMLLKNVLSSKGARLSLKTISFKVEATFPSLLSVARMVSM